MRWSSERTGRRSSIAARMSEMSISIWDRDGVPTVRTIARAFAASATRPVSSRSTRWRSSGAPGSSKGIRRSRRESRRSAAMSTPRTLRPRSAKVSARGSPMRPRPTMATSVSTPGTLASAAMRPELTGEAGDEARVVPRVALPEAPRLPAEPVGPLEPELLHEVGGLGLDAGVEVERGADADEHGGRQPVAHLGHPLLLLGHADPHPHHVRSRRVDVAGDPVLLLLVQGAERRRVAADDLEAGMVAAQVLGELDERTLVLAPVEVGAAARL